jgi:adenylate cyclase
MASLPSALQRERVRLFRRILYGSAVVGALFGLLVSPHSSSVLVSMGLGVINGLGIAGSIAAIDIFVLREGSSMKRLLRLPFFAVVLLKTVVYAAITSAFVIGTPHLAARLSGAGAASLEPRTALATIGFSMAMTLVIVILLQASGLLGRRTFRDLLLGRYRNPRAERRFFLFVDVVGSTAIAERLGPLQAHRFLAAVFSAVAEPVHASGGEIYQYVGDEIVVTWTEDEGRREARPLRCFFLMESVLQGMRAEFLAQFGAEPALRGALHLGDVIAGEVGEVRRAIVYHGDVMNTASRLEQATRELGCRFIASAAAVGTFPPDGEFRLRDLGELSLRGRKQPMRAFEVMIDGKGGNT